MDARPGLVDLCDLLLFVLLIPALLVLAGSLPGDWAHHQGDALTGTATITKLDRVRGGDVPIVDVRSSEGAVVARDQEVNGDTVEKVGATFPIEYLPVDEEGGTQVYVAGHDPFGTNFAVFGVALLAWLVSVPFVVIRLARGLRRMRNRPKRGSRQYSAGRGYVRD